MKQAVCYLQNIPPEHCFHIAQVWLLILDDCTLAKVRRIRCANRFSTGGLLC